MSPTARPPEPMIPVPIAKGCLLLLTPEEFERGIRRGKSHQRREALTRRVAVESKHSTITVVP